MRTNPKNYALKATPYVRNELQLRLAWCRMGLTQGKYDSQEMKRSKVEKVLLMTHLRDLIICEGAAVACAKRRDALCFNQKMLEQMSVPAVTNCVETLREGSELPKTLLLQALLDINQSKPLRVNMNKPVELEHLRKIYEIRSF